MLRLSLSLVIGLHSSPCLGGVVLSPTPGAVPQSLAGPIVPADLAPAAPQELPALDAPSSPLPALATLPETSPVNQPLALWAALPSAVSPAAASLSVSPAILDAPRSPEATPPPAREELRSLSEGVAELERVSAPDPGGPAAQESLERLFSGPAHGPAQASGADLPDTVVNEEGVELFGQSALYYREVQRTVAGLRGKVRLDETLDVMDDSYASVWAKVSVLEALTRGRGALAHNAHLGGTLFWVDAVYEEPSGMRTAIHTHRVFFHRAQNPRSEIEEGIRRLDGYVKEAVSLLGRGGRAESVLGPLDRVRLVFDAQGYEEIKDWLRAKERELAREHGTRFEFSFLDEIVTPPRTLPEMHRSLNELTRRHKSDEMGQIIDGVIYSRYVGLLLELKTLEFFRAIGWEILQSGREAFDAEGKYVTELDAVVRDPDGKVFIVEAKSARVALPKKKVLRSKVLSKLDTYVANRRLLEDRIGSPFDGVIFSVDVGAHEDLKEFLKEQEPELSRQYGFPVHFVFLRSAPKDDPLAPALKPSGP